MLIFWIDYKKQESRDGRIKPSRPQIFFSECICATNLPQTQTLQRAARTARRIYSPYILLRFTATGPRTPPCLSCYLRLQCALLHTTFKRFYKYLKVFLKHTSVGEWRMLVWLDKSGRKDILRTQSHKHSHGNKTCFKRTLKHILTLP